MLEVSERPEGPYFVMPYLAGGSLAEKIKPGESLPPDEILNVGRNVAEALHYARTHGIIHRDLKPSNILLDGEGRAFLCDFGLLRTVFNDSIVDVTRPQMEGTVPYMSPAVAEGKAEDTRCDIYGFGCLLYEMLTGQPPYQGPSVDVIVKQIHAGPPQPIRQVNPNAPAHLVTIAEGAMARELRDRYAAMADVIGDMERVAQRKAPLGPHGHVLRSRPGRMIAGVVGVVVVLALVAAAALHFRERKVAANSPASRSATPATAPAATAQVPFEYTTNNGEITITKYTGPGGDVTIPSTIHGLPVTCIGREAFRGLASLTSVTIPDGIMMIEWCAFHACSGLTKVTIPSSVVSISGNAFSNCSGLTHVTIPASVTFIDASSFNNCSGQISITVDAANPAYSSSADGVLFNKNKTSLVCCPDSKVGNYAIPDSVTNIGEWAFLGCGNLTSVMIPDSVTSIAGAAFQDCVKLTNVVIPNSVTNMEEWAFHGCTGLTNVTLPAGMTSVLYCK